MAYQITQEINARGSFCPGPMMELIRAIKSGAVGDVIAVLSSDQGSRRDIPKWVEKAGHELVAIEACYGYDRIIVRKRK
ncbi:preprotein translocase subunit TatB [Alicyclobacillus cellulosilyticus]|uniref:Preprotein translocase subunit TatB n=1 Tax=Alicyclobacillus cellulosilyticus TaxID=1003997 RepID=A0A917KES3_9BACL|nr:sulfurtransferase TusA family protein [Alicyclobacillus cellulosilyticus]GGJ07885.1 preprotein translocase subunit TatB [Alicyclobacillus cellulosilyticus]